ncbi:long-chain fatty acid transport protein 1 [Parasteatoda tepidariorum]
MLGVVLIFGGKMVIRKKFSASNFWKDVSKYKVTVTQYIGEICRYLLNQPVTPEETQHCLRLMVGNGLRPHVWKEFKDRFRIKEIIEIYGATEGNTNIANLFGKVGAVGYFPKVMQRLFPVELMKINPETGELLRDKNGLCIRCKPGEHGEIVGKIVKHNPLNAFDGYANKAESNKKIITNCFTRGDMAVRSGDILVMDEEGYLYFIDRSGDTFRWKGENVSTGEVENIVSKVLNHSACVVYGVEIPNNDGRAGMAAVQMKANDINCSDLYLNLKKKLPSYALPMFIRVCDDLELTGTYKLRKVSLQKEGYNPENVSDALYFIDHKQKSYVPLTRDRHEDIISGRVRL